MEYQCFYCDVGKVEKLPADCPECDAHLRKPVEELTPEELRLATQRKTGFKAEMSLAC